MFETGGDGVPQILRDLIAELAGPERRLTLPFQLAGLGMLVALALSDRTGRLIAATLAASVAVHVLDRDLRRNASFASGPDWPEEPLWLALSGGLALLGWAAILVQFARGRLGPAARAWAAAGLIAALAVYANREALIDLGFVNARLSSPASLAVMMAAGFLLVAGLYHLIDRREARAPSGSRAFAKAWPAHLALLVIGAAMSEAPAVIYALAIRAPEHPLASALLTAARLGAVLRALAWLWFFALCLWAITRRRRAQITPGVFE